METGPPTSPDRPVDVSIDKVWGDAWAVYKLLLRRSIVTAAVVYAIVDGTNPVSDAIHNRGARIGLGVLGFLLALAGPVLVQGALVVIVRDVHDGRRPETVRELLGHAWRRFGSLMGASILYGLGVLLGLLALIVPGLLAASRWCLMAPLIMLEGEGAFDARDRSSERVKPYTWGVLGIVVATFAATTLIHSAVPALIGIRYHSTLFRFLLGVVASSLTAPFYAHVLTVMYYRITNPDQPVIHPDVRTWRSVWSGS
jgi:hypothetical protein